ncbi:MAG TPA: MBL fold metallo-hydrolase [Terracidiphilus sp.]|jgi:beta-lactamase superfamily II metal-dependent hydrolase|nr:MBL fold metallo-hydrolase [Terracidiphilus sp.]
MQEETHTEPVIATDDFTRRSFFSLLMYSCALPWMLGSTGCTIELNRLLESINQSVTEVLALKRSGFTLWQLQSVDDSIMMGYILLTSQNKVIVIDGGNADQCFYMEYFLGLLGNRVSAWYLSHPHNDHVGALATLLSEGTDIQIDRIYASFPTRKWVAMLSDDEDESSTLRMYDLFASSNAVITRVSLGQANTHDEMNIEVLGVNNPEITTNGVNNSSMLLKVSDANKAAIFLGDLGVEEWTKAKSSPNLSRFSADYVQVAHHGWADGIEELYRQIAPSCGLWPTTFGEVNGGGGYPAGATRSEQALLALFKQMGVNKQYFSFDQLYRID